LNNFSNPENFIENNYQNTSPFRGYLPQLKSKVS
jgi:hypothetical protein